MKLEVRSSLSAVDPATWDALVGDGSPFLEWGWLASLEESGCVAASTGWLPQHLTLWEDGHIVGACPLYVKGHSQGEFVFDHGWADAAARAGIAYYPKLLVAIPFTPATGARLLVHPRVDPTRVVPILGAALKEVCSQSGFSSVHVNFCLPNEVTALDALGFVRRTGYQFQWINPGGQSFDDYLAGFRSKRRVQIKRERRELAAQSTEITVHAGSDIPDDLFAPMFRLYKSTIDKLYWGREYLNEALFELLRQRWKHRLCFFVARRNGKVIAGTFTVRKGDVLYGRYWGAFEELRYLHFNVCYYASIEYCLQEGVARFEPGAGGEFKHLRGFDARPTESMHYLANPRLARAVRDYLAKERRAVTDEIEWFGERSALKRETRPLSR
jgi:predicted N-acyltransferase